MKDDMYQTVARAMSESKVVFVLLSDEYCKSDFCRREWHYALNERIKVYVLVVQPDFDKQKYDWVRFCFGAEVYYKMHNKDDLQKLFNDASIFLNKKIENEAKPLSSRPLPPISTKRSSNNEYSRKSLISTWTSEDIQNWCSDNHLDKWSEPLKYFDGSSLLVLRRDLSDHLLVPYIVQENNLNGFDVARFKSEIDKLSSIPKTAEPKPLPKKRITKRCASKTSNK